MDLFVQAMLSLEDRVRALCALLLPPHSKQFILSILGVVLLWALCIVLIFKLSLRHFYPFFCLKYEWLLVCSRLGWWRCSCFFFFCCFRKELWDGRQRGYLGAGCLFYLSVHFCNAVFCGNWRFCKRFLGVRAGYWERKVEKKVVLISLFIILGLILIRLWCFCFYVMMIMR